MDEVISTSNLTKRYGTTVAVDHLSLHVSRGEIYGFIGLNGAGKTTTIRMLLGMIRPSEGVARVFGTEVKADLRDIWSRVGYLVEIPYAYPELTVRENLEIARLLRRVSDPHAVGRIIEELALSPYANRRARTLSRGNAQRLGLAKALLHDPDVLILDEPTNGLDPAGVVEVREMLRDLVATRGVTVFVSSHILSEVARITTRIGIIHRGRLIKELNADKLELHQWLTVGVRNHEVARTTLTNAGFAVRTGGDGTFHIDGTRAVEHPDEVASLLVRAGTPPTLLVVEGEDLESYFLRLVGTEREDQP
jgi:ABC-2 type transport system ATP-binding protein